MGKASNRAQNIRRAWKYNNQKLLHLLKDELHPKEYGGGGSLKELNEMNEYIKRNKQNFKNEDLIRGLHQVYTWLQEDAVPDTTDLIFMLYNILQPSPSDGL